jgi:hypothetical protein
MNTKRTHIVIPQQAVAEIGTSAGLRQIKALEGAAGPWKDKDHPELQQGAAKWVRKPRQEYDRRFEKVATR